MQVYCDKPRYTICAIRYASTLQYSMMYIVFGTEQQKRAQARNTCVHVRRAWESVFIFCFFRFFNSKFIPLIVLIVFQLKTKPSEDCSQLISALGYIRYLISYQVHRLLRRKSAIRLCVYSSQVSCQYEICYLYTHTHTDTQAYTYIRDIMIITVKRWRKTAGKLRRSWCPDANEWNQNQLFKFLMRILWLCLHFLFVVFSFLVFFFASLFFSYALNMNTCKWDAIKILLLLPTKKSMEKWFLICVVCVKIIACCCCCCF